ncbi:MAG TPA: hypothetical protein VEJ18_19015 [Planctomycetota bacterium]|nr:hypothetical protein [Planctomycetota bacterium]
MLAALLVLAVQDPPRVEPGLERWSAVRIGVSGRLEMHYLHRDDAINQAGGAVTSSTNAWSGRVNLRLDVEVADRVQGVLELENRRFDEGLNEPFGQPDEEDDLTVKQGYIDVPGLPARAFRLRIGVQELTIRNRPHDDAFFLDLGETEGFFAGFNPAAGRIDVTFDRDVREAVGARLDWSPLDFLTARAFALVVGEQGSTEEDEALYGLSVNANLAETMAAWLMGVVVSGGEPDLEQVWTLGAGWNAYFGRRRDVELFAEAYLQRGTLTDAPDRVSKRAFGGQAGGRLSAVEKLWIELAGAIRTGDEDPGDGTDEAFQSYEYEHRFLILESAEFGLDVDTNVIVVRGGLGLGPLEVDGRPLHLRVDVGRFRADETLSGEDAWGVETDLTVRWNFNASLTLAVQAAILAGSDILEAITADRDDEAFAVVGGADLRF